MEKVENGCDTFESGSSEDSCKSKKFHYMESRFECPICLSCLKSPYITSCGHKFCKECIHQWLRKEGSTCPIDNQKLSSDHDLFPDNYTKREISQQIVTCPFPECSEALPLLEAEKHLYESHDNEEMHRRSCPFSKVGCTFLAESHPKLVHHLQSFLNHHLLLLLNSYDSLKETVKGEDESAWDPPSKSSISSPTHLLKTLYEKIVRLEQSDQEKIIDMSVVKDQIKAIVDQINSDRVRRTDGVLVWKISKIKQIIGGMYSDPTVKLFSDGFYTSYYGYKFCCRLNLSNQNPEFLSFNVHLMKGENDYALNWPFSGRITVCLVHSFSHQLSIKEVMVSNPSLEAFARPKSDISLRAFGYSDFIKVSDLLEQGYINADDSIIIRVDINCI